MRRKRLLVAAVALAVAGLLAAWGGRHLWAYRHSRAAERALARYRPAEALGHLQKALKVWPDSAATHLLAAQAARRAGDFDAAEHHLDEHRRLVPDIDEARGLEAGLLRAQNGDLESVEPALVERVHNGDPRTPLILEALIEGNLRMYRFSGAMSCVELWLSHDPDNPQALYLRGRAWDRVGAHTRARQDFSRVLELDDEHDDARLRLANALFQAGLSKDAVGHLEVLTQRRPDDPEVAVRLAFARNALGEGDEAERLLTALLDRRPGYAPALLGLGQLALQAGRAAEAESWLRQALALDGHDRQGNYLLLQALRRQRGKAKEAEAQEAKLKQVERDHNRLIEIGNSDMNKRPRDPALHYEVGAIQQRLGHGELASRWFHSALMLDKKYRPAHVALAEHYARAGDEARAARHRELAGPEKK